MDFPILVVSISNCPLFTLNGLNYDVFLSPKVVFILENITDHDEMEHHAAFHLRFHCLPKYPFKGSSTNKVNLDLWVLYTPLPLLRRFDRTSLCIFIQFCCSESACQTSTYVLFKLKRMALQLCSLHFCHLWIKNISGIPL